MRLLRSSLLAEALGAAKLALLMTRLPETEQRTARRPGAIEHKSDNAA